MLRNICSIRLGLSASTESELSSQQSPRDPEEDGSLFLGKVGYYDGKGQECLKQFNKLLASTECGQDFHLIIRYKIKGSITN